MLWFALAYKKKGDDDRTLDLKGSHAIEIAWATLPSFLLIAMFVMGFTNYVKSTVPPAESMPVQIQGWQWDWDYTYPTLGGFTTKDLVVPEKTPVRLQMLSKDVLHSFYVPDFRIKKDVLPNRYTTQWFETLGIFEGNEVYTRNNGYSDYTEKDKSELGTSGYSDVASIVVSQCQKEKEAAKEAKLPDIDCPTDVSQVKAGQHQVFCTEYCGDHHSRMLSKIVVLQEEHFNLWVRGMRNFDPYDKNGKFGGDMVKIGEYLSQKAGCRACHTINGQGSTGPTWKGLWNADRPGAEPTNKADENYIRTSIVEPGAYIATGGSSDKMPINGGYDAIEEKDITAIIEYIKTLQ